MAQHHKQGVVGTVREFAAAHAASEEFARASKQMNELLRIDKLEEAQRRMAELSRDKVHRAVNQSRKEGETNDEADQPDEAAESNDLRGMAAEVRAANPGRINKSTPPAPAAS